VVKLGKAVRTTFELRSNQEGEARIPSIPQGKILVQIIAKGYQTFGQTFDITEEEKTLDITRTRRSNNTPRTRSVRFIATPHDFPARIRLRISP